MQLIWSLNIKLEVKNVRQSCNDNIFGNIYYLLIYCYIYVFISKGASICKTDEEKFYEDEEQMKIISKDEKNRGKSKWINYLVH